MFMFKKLANSMISEEQDGIVEYIKSLRDIEIETEPVSEISKPIPDVSFSNEQEGKVLRNIFQRMEIDDLVSVIKLADSIKKMKQEAHVAIGKISDPRKTRDRLLYYTQNNHFYLIEALKKNFLDDKSHAFKTFEKTLELEWLDVFDLLESAKKKGKLDYKIDETNQRIRFVGKLMSKVLSKFDRKNPDGNIDYLFATIFNEKKNDGNYIFQIQDIANILFAYQHIIDFGGSKMINYPKMRDIMVYDEITGDIENVLSDFKVTKSEDAARNALKSLFAEDLDVDQQLEIFAFYDDFVNRQEMERSHAEIIDGFRRSGKIKAIILFAEYLIGRATQQGTLFGGPTGDMKLAQDVKIRLDEMRRTVSTIRQLVTPLALNEVFKQEQQKQMLFDYLNELAATIKSFGRKAETLELKNWILLGPSGTGKTLSATLYAQEFIQTYYGDSLPKKFIVKGKQRFINPAFKSYADFLIKEIKYGDRKSTPLNQMDQIAELGFFGLKSFTDYNIKASPHERIGSANFPFIKIMIINEADNLTKAEVSRMKKISEESVQLAQEAQTKKTKTNGVILFILTSNKSQIYAQPMETTISTESKLLKDFSKNFNYNWKDERGFKLWDNNQGALNCEVDIFKKYYKGEHPEDIPQHIQVLSDQWERLAYFPFSLARRFNPITFDKFELADFSEYSEYIVNKAQESGFDLKLSKTDIDRMTKKVRDMNKFVKELDLKRNVLVSKASMIFLHFLAGDIFD